MFSLSASISVIRSYGINIDGVSDILNVLDDLGQVRKDGYIDQKNLDRQIQKYRKAQKAA